MDGQNAPEPKPKTNITPPEQEQDEYDAASKDTAKYIASAFPQKSKKKWKKLLLILLAVLLVAGAGVAAYILFFKTKPATAPTTDSNTSQTQTPSKVTKETKRYDSANFNLGFDYPADWEVVDTAGTGRLTVTSPAMKLKDASGKEVDGQIVLTIRDKAQKLTEFDKGNAQAVIDSEKITYIKPTEVQRGNTYLSFLAHAGSASSGALDGVYITGDNGYEKGQDIPQSDIAKVDPVINISFIKCSDSKCSGEGMPLSITDNSWDDLSETIKSILQSLSIQ